MSTIIWIVLADFRVLGFGTRFAGADGATGAADCSISTPSGSTASAGAAAAPDPELVRPLDDDAETGLAATGFAAEERGLLVGASRFVVLLVVAAGDEVDSPNVATEVSGWDPISGNDTAAGTVAESGDDAGIGATTDIKSTESSFASSG
jgi:hypothetical protein